MAIQTSIPKEIRKLLAFGSGVGIEVGAADLEVAAARVRPAGVRVLGRTTIAGYAARQAAEWGAEYARFLKALGIGHLSATVLLPRREVIVRQLALPGVAPRDIPGAIRLQLDSLHPYGEDEVSWGWSRLAYGAVLVGICRQSVVDRYVQLFLEAGVAVSSFTFSAAAVHAAIRLNGHQQGAGFVALSRSATGAVEVYGESEARPVFSAELDTPLERAVIMALSELRLPPDTAPLQLEQILPRPAVNPVENDLSRNARPYATALAGACPRLAPAANVLPLEHRRFSSRAMFIPTIALAALLLLAAAAMWGYSKYAQRQYLARLQAEIARLTPRKLRADNLDRETAKELARVRLLDEYRKQTRYDLDTLNELTRLVEPPAWTNAIQLTRDNVTLNGQAAQATPLVNILDSSPFFKNASLESDVNTGSIHQFQIRASRGARP
jgi:Tfp pilus assembly protein PilN